MTTIRIRLAAGLLLAGLGISGIATSARADPVGTRYPSSGTVFQTGDGRVITVPVDSACDVVHQVGAMHLNCATVQMASGKVVWSYETRSSGRNAFVLWRNVGPNKWKRVLVARETSPLQWADARAMAYDVDRDGHKELVVGLRRTDVFSGPLDLYILDYSSSQFRTSAVIKNLDGGGATVIAGSLRTFEMKYAPGDPAGSPSLKDWNRVERVSGVYKVTRRAIRSAALADLWYSDF